MTKFVVFFSKLIAATMAALALTSCNELVNSISGSGNVVTEKRSVGSFDKVIVSQGLDCEIILSDSHEVTVEADDNLINGIHTTVHDGTLDISSEYDNYINVTSKRIIVRMPKIASLESNSGATLTSGNILLGENISVKSSSGSSASVELEADNVTLETSSGSEQTIRGKALKVNSSSSSGSNLDADGLLANEVYAQSSSGSSSSVSAAVRLDAKASSGSSIRYRGNAKDIRKEESSGGSVSKE